MGKSWDVLPWSGYHGPAKVLKSSVNWVARWLALARNLYFVSAGFS